jgi:hypothetical protein
MSQKVLWTQSFTGAVVSHDASARPDAIKNRIATSFFDTFPVSQPPIHRPIDA